MLEEMLDFGREVVGHLREFLVHGAHDFERMAGAVQKIRIAERQMFRAGVHLPPDVFQHGMFRDQKEPALIDRHDRAMETTVEAAPAGLHIAGEMPCAFVIEPRVFVH